MGGFVNWTHTVAASGSVDRYRNKVSDAETVSLWQSLSFGANYKAAYCLAVCPAGEEVIAPFLGNRKDFLDGIVRPLQEKQEIVYVTPESDAETYVQRRYPHKTTKRVGNGLRVTSIDGFLVGMRRTFQRGKSEGLNAVYHFTFTGKEPRTATVTIRDKTLDVQAGHVGAPNFQLKADSESWIRFLTWKPTLIWALLTRKVTFRGSPKLLLAFGKCFPG
jgi:hypothetical protein